MKLLHSSLSLLSRRFRTLLLGLVAFTGLASSVVLAEDCIPFDPDRTAVRRLSGRWKVVSGNMILLDFGGSRAEAEQALRVIQHYGLNSQCFVGRPGPSMEYYLVDGQAPRGAMAGEDSIPFDPARLAVRRINGRWKIVEGNHWLLDFGGNLNEARESLSLIRKYGFTRICFVGRPDASMTYFRTDCAGPALSQVSLASTQLTINGPRVQYKASYHNDCGTPLNAVLQTWIEQGQTRRAAGGVRVDCDAGTCVRQFTIGASDAAPTAGSGEFVPGRATALFELKVDNRVVSTRRVAVELVLPCTGPALSRVSLESRELTINGPRVDYEASFGDDCGLPLDAVLQTWIEQGQTRRAAGGRRVSCGAGDDCSVEFTIGASDEAPTAGSGEFAPGRATAVFELKVDGEVVSSRRIGITLYAPEDCISFDYRRIRVQQVGGRWKIVEGSHWLMDFGASRDEAVQAFRIIRHYRMDSMCFVGRPDPSMQYFLVDGEAPRGPFAGEDAIPFNPERLQVRSVGGRWKVAEGGHLLLDFDQNVDEARAALRIIQHYGFNRICFVGRPDASMTYFRIAEESELAPRFVRGDTNGNGRVDVNDAIVLSSYVLQGEQGGVSCLKALDVNDDSRIDYNDTVDLIRYVYSRSAPPAAPFPACGIDPTADRLTCETQCD